MGDKSWECDDCDNTKKRSRNCSLSLLDEDDPEIEFTESDDGRYVYVDCHNVQKEVTNFNLTLGKFRLKVCPVGLIGNDTRRWINLFFLCRELKCLPQSGGLLEQDNYTIEVFEVLASELAKIEKESIKSTKEQPSSGRKEGLRTKGKSP